MADAAEAEDMEASDSEEQDMTQGQEQAMLAINNEDPEGLQRAVKVCPLLVNLFMPTLGARE